MPNHNVESSSAANPFVVNLCVLTAITRAPFTVLPTAMISGGLRSPAQVADERPSRLECGGCPNPSCAGLVHVVLMNSRVVESYLFASCLTIRSETHIA